MLLYVVYPFLSITEGSRRFRVRAFVYLRVSSKDQVKGTSLDKQREICQIIARNFGIPDIDFYEEPGISGESIKNRPVFKSLLQKIRGREYDNGIGISFDQDRLTRRTVDWSQITELLKQHNIRLHTSQGIMDFQKRDQRLTANIKGSLSEWHLDYIREQTLDGKRRKLLEGEWQGGLILWGYRFNPSLPKGRRLEIDPEKAKLVRTLFIELESLPLCEIAKEMNRKNIPSPRGGNWNSNKVTAFFDEIRLLRYSGYTKIFYQLNGDGEWIHLPEGIVIKAKWDPIITKEERDRLIRKKKDWRRHRTYPTKSNKLITGLGIAFCGYCGTAVSTTSFHKNKDETVRAYYGCMNRSCLHRSNFRMQTIDSLITKTIQAVDPRNVLQGYNYFTQLQKEQDISSTLADIEKRVAMLVSKRNRLVDKISSGLIQDEEAKSVLKKLRENLMELEDQKSKVAAEGKGKFLSLAEFRKLKKVFRQFDRFPQEEKKLGLKALVKRIEVFKDRWEIEFRFPINEEAESKLICPVSSTG